VAAIHLAGLRDEPCGAVRCTAPQGSQQNNVA